MESRNNERVYQLCIITSPSAKEDKSVLKKKSDLEEYAHNGWSAMWGVTQDGLDITKFILKTQKIICWDVDIYFDSIYNNIALTTYTGPDNTKIKLNASNAVLIFSNQKDEIEKICKKISSLAKNQSNIMVATSLKNLNLENVIVINTNANNFWEIVRDQIALLPEKTPEKSSCLTM